MTPSIVPMTDFSNGGSVTFTATTNVSRERWKSRPYFKPNSSSVHTALIPVGGQIEIEYPQTGEVAMRFTITGGEREYTSRPSRKYVKIIMLDYDTDKQLTTTYGFTYSGDDSDLEFKPI